MTKETTEKSAVKLYMQDMAITLGRPLRFVYKNGEDVITAWLDRYGQLVTSSMVFDRLETVLSEEPERFTLPDFDDTDTVAVDFNVTKVAFFDLLMRPIKINNIWHDSQGKPVGPEAAAKLEMDHQNPQFPLPQQ
ncbi:hypothetical protein C4579_00410 [Candidatus Microgenomates bacterium]|nr:MAG: hypothetical protein C4579_00410 [Candidatus Microgenomates bacterium]